jgi:hypothetical protein
MTRIQRGMLKDGQTRLEIGKRRLGCLEQEAVTTRVRLGILFGIIWMSRVKSSARASRRALNCSMTMPINDRLVFGRQILD